MQAEFTPTNASASAGAHRDLSPAQGAATSKRWIQWGVYLLATALGLYYGYDIGSRVSGMAMGVVMALNTAVFASIMAGAVSDRLWQWWADSRNRG